MSVTDIPSFRAGFDFARSLRNPAVRDRLKALGFDGDAGDVIVACGPDESFEDAARRNDDERRALLVRQDASQPGGWVMQWATRKGDDS